MGEADDDDNSFETKRKSLTAIAVVAGIILGFLTFMLIIKMWGVRRGQKSVTAQGATTEGTTNQGATDHHKKHLHITGGDVFVDDGRAETSMMRIQSLLRQR